jgi:hypothetical protein
MTAGSIGGIPDSDRMDEQYKKERERQEKIARTVGLSAAVLINLSFIAVGSTTGMKYLYPPPEEQSLLLDFSDYEAEIPEQVLTGTQPRSAEARPEEEVQLIQQSQAQNEGTELNEAKEAVTDDFGDVEVKEPPRKKEIDRRALFHAADNKTRKDTLAPQTAAKPGDGLKAGHASGNTLTGETMGEPNAQLEGRSVLGTLPSPEYNVQAYGKVVVEILVDRNGTVVEANPGAAGTTVTDKTLWEAARAVALKAQFNLKADAPQLQKGTITYIFNLR